jgi:predicted  nucleic acid-binding Zn-ribbon protein
MKGETMFAKLKIVPSAPALVPIMEHPAFRALSEACSALRAEADTIKAEIRRLELRAAELPETGSLSEIDRIARAELDGNAETADETAADLVARIATLKTRHAITRHKFNLKLQELQTMRSEMSLDAVEAFRPEHKAAVAQVLAAWAALREAMAAERATRSAFAEAGYDQRLPEYGPQVVFVDYGYDICRWEVAAREYAA